MTDDRALIETMSAETPALHDILPGATVSQNAEPDPWLGRVLSNVYAIEEKIGEGGMGVVYAARHIHLGKRYAIKVLSFDGTAHDNAIERLKQEAVAASRIDHDNIVEVISFDQDEHGSVFIVMELLEGVSLHQRVKAGPMESREALRVALQVASALSAAHKSGIIHRDLKPENVFLVQKRGRSTAKVLDFGISKVKAASEEDVRITRTGQLVGTPLYMSPEQARGDVDIDARIDVYALGVMLYEMLTGSTPFEGQNYFQLLWKHGNEEPQAPRQRCPTANISPEVESLVLAALTKNRDLRIASMDEFGAQILRIAPELEVRESRSSLDPAGRSDSGPRSSGVAAQRSMNTLNTVANTSRVVPIGIAAALLASVAALLWSRGAQTTDSVVEQPHTTGQIQTAVRPPMPPPMRVEHVLTNTAFEVQHRVAFRSTPAGAVVLETIACDGCPELSRPVCTTPCETTFSASTEARHFSISRAGFHTRNLQVTIDQDQTLPVTLVPLTRRTANPHGLPIKTNM